MKSDVLTLAAVVFVVGVLVSSLGLSEIFETDSSLVPPTELQLGSQDNYTKSK